MATSINLLRVPIRVDALYVSPKDGGGYPLGAFTADFSTLPYCVSDGSLNDDNPNFGLTLVGSLPSSLTFPPGLHLHWALPNALANGRHDEKGTRFPAVPNRWLVRRFDDKRTLQKAWIVESDFLHPCDGTGNPTILPPPQDQGNPITAWPDGSPITFPTKRFQLSSGNAGAAFRYMGRSLLLSDWLKNAGGGSDQYLNQDASSAYKLTARRLRRTHLRRLLSQLLQRLRLLRRRSDPRRSRFVRIRDRRLVPGTGAGPVASEGVQGPLPRRPCPIRRAGEGISVAGRQRRRETSVSRSDGLLRIARDRAEPRDTLEAFGRREGRYRDREHRRRGAFGPPRRRVRPGSGVRRSGSSPDQADRGRPTRGDEPGVVAPRRVG